MRRGRRSRWSHVPCCTALTSRALCAASPTKCWSPGAARGDSSSSASRLGGVALAARLQSIVDEIEPGTSSHGALDITLYRDDLARTPTRTPAPTRIPTEGIDDAIVVLVDDVLYSGRTIRAALDALADHGRPRAVRLAVLVDRGHRELPIRADFVGKNLPSSTSERVSVHLDEFDGVDEVVIEP